MPYVFDYRTNLSQGQKCVSLYDNSLNTYRKWDIPFHTWYKKWRILVKLTLLFERKIFEEFWNQKMTHKIGKIKLTVNNLKIYVFRKNALQWIKISWETVPGEV